ncbi:hypothetical protein LguiA_001831 [Lonicera macranthoides]
MDQALDWGKMADDEPFQSWEARADAQFASATARNENTEACIQLQRDDNSSILNQNFPPLKEDSPAILNSHGNKFPHSIDTSSLGGSEYAPSPLKTRAQRQKKGQPLPLTKQMKTVNRELKAYSRKSKSTAQPQTSNPDAFQWQLYEKDKKKREDEATTTIANDEQHQWKVCVYAKSPIVTAGASGTISSPLNAENITIAHEEKAK